MLFLKSVHIKDKTFNFNGGAFAAAETQLNKLSGFSPNDRNAPMTSVHLKICKLEWLKYKWESY